MRKKEVADELSLNGWAHGSDVRPGCQGCDIQTSELNPRRTNLKCTYVTVCLAEGYTVD